MSQGHSSDVNRPEDVCSYIPTTSSF